MRKTNKIKSYLARVLAATMVFTMVAPSVPGYAFNGWHNADGNKIAYIRSGIAGIII